MELTRPLSAVWWYFHIDEIFLLPLVYLAVAFFDRWWHTVVLLFLMREYSVVKLAVKNTSEQKFQLSQSYPLHNHARCFTKFLFSIEQFTWILSICVYYVSYAHTTFMIKIRKCFTYYKTYDIFIYMSDLHRSFEFFKENLLVSQNLISFRIKLSFFKILFVLHRKNQHQNFT